MEGTDLPISPQIVPTPSSPSSLISAYWIIPGACFGLSAVTALFMKYRDHMLKVKSNAENLETWTDPNEIEEMKAQIQERGKLCSLLRQELEQALQQEEQSVEELQWLIRDIERQKELEKEALSQRNANDKYKDKLLILKKELTWWKERARNLKDGSVTVAETEALKTNAERALVEKERELMKKKRALHELRRRRWEKPFRTIMPADIESVSTEYSTAFKFLNSNSEESVKSANSSTALDTHAQRQSSYSLQQRNVSKVQATNTGSIAENPHSGASSVDAQKDLEGVPRKASGSSIVPENPTPAVLAGSIADSIHEGECCQEMSPIKKSLMRDNKHQKRWRSVFNLGPAKGISRKPSISSDQPLLKEDPSTSARSETEHKSYPIMEFKSRKTLSSWISSEDFATSNDKQPQVFSQEASSSFLMRKPSATSMPIKATQSFRQIVAASKDLTLQSKRSTWHLETLQTENAHLEKNEKKICMGSSQTVTFKRDSHHTSIKLKNTRYPAHWAALKKRSLMMVAASETTRISRSDISEDESPDAITAKDISSSADEDSTQNFLTPEIRSEEASKDEECEAETSVQKTVTNNCKDLEESSTHASSPLSSLSEHDNDNTLKDSAFHSAGKSMATEGQAGKTGERVQIVTIAEGSVRNLAMSDSGTEDKAIGHLLLAQEDPHEDASVISEELVNLGGIGASEPVVPQEEADPIVGEVHPDLKKDPVSSSAHHKDSDSTSLSARAISSISPFLLKTGHQTVIKKSSSQAPFPSNKKGSEKTNPILHVSQAAALTLSEPVIEKTEESQQHMITGKKESSVPCAELIAPVVLDKDANQQFRQSGQVKASDLVATYLHQQQHITADSQIVITAGNGNKTGSNMQNVSSICQPVPARDIGNTRSQSYHSMRSCDILETEFAMEPSAGAGQNPSKASENISTRIQKTHVHGQRERIRVRKKKHIHERRDPSHQQSSKPQKKHSFMPAAEGSLAVGNMEALPGRGSLESQVRRMEFNPKESLKKPTCSRKLMDDEEAHISPLPTLAAEVGSLAEMVKLVDHSPISDGNDSIKADLLMLESKRGSSGAFTKPESSDTYQTPADEMSSTTDEAATLFRNDSSKIRTPSSTTADKSAAVNEAEGSPLVVAHKDGESTQAPSGLSGTSSSASPMNGNHEDDTRLATSAFSTCSSSGSSDSIQLLILE